MLNNPLIQRYRASLMGTHSILIYVILYSIAVVMLVLSCAASADLESPAAFHDISRLVFRFLAIAQAVLLLGWAAYNSAQAIRMEYERKSYDFFRMLPLTAHEKAIGVLVGRNLAVLILVAINTCLMLLFARNQYFNIQIQLMVWSGAFVMNTLSLLSSCTPQKTKSKSRNGSSGAVVLGMILLYFTAGALISNISGCGSGEMYATAVSFGPVRIPFYVAFTVVALTLGGWCYAGVLRRFTVEDMPLFSRKGAVVFAANIMGLFLMFICPHVDSGNYIEISGAVMLVGLVLSILILSGSLNLAIHYMETIRRSGDTSLKAVKGRLRYISNFYTAGWLFAIQCIAIAIVIVPNVDSNVADIFPAILGMALTYIFLVLVSEIYSLYAGANRLIGLMISFLMILYVAIPLILSALLHHGDLALLSGVNYMIGSLAGECRLGLRSIITLIMLISNGTLLVYMYTLVRRQAGVLARFATQL